MYIIIGKVKLIINEFYIENWKRHSLKQRNLSETIYIKERKEY